VLLCRLSVCCIACGFTFAVFNSPPALQRAHTIRAGGQNFVEKLTCARILSHPHLHAFSRRQGAKKAPPQSILESR
jgi:hypothetical protein